MDTHEKCKRVFFMLDYLILLIFSYFEGHQMTILDPFGGPWAPFGHHFAVKWVTDAHRWTLEGRRMDF